MILMLSLNRTSVGLKLGISRSTARRWLEPQSNQRGIETAEPRGTALPIGVPQSNQRGIETAGSIEAYRRWVKPQSNQRGIETVTSSGGNTMYPPASIEPAWD